MQIIIKGTKGFEIYDKNRYYIEKKFAKFAKWVKEPATLEITFQHTHGTRANLDKRVHLTFSMPGLKSAEHIEELSEHFTQSIDLLQKRFEKFLARFKEKKRESERQSKAR